MQALFDHGAREPVLDYGSGWGGLTEKLLAGGFDTLGLELSLEMTDYCRKHNLPVEQGDITIVQGRIFRTLVLCTVFEHLVEHESWLVRANRLLEPGGLLVTLQPTAPFADFMGRLTRLGNLNAPLPSLHRVFCPPWHTAFFSLEGLEILISRHGFELLEIRPAPQGRERGVVGVAQAGLEVMNRLGWNLLGRKWPLLTSHIFILRKDSKCT